MMPSLLGWKTEYIVVPITEGGGTGGAGLKESITNLVLVV